MKALASLVLGMSLVFGAVDINSASKEELMSLKGIGEKKAEAIIAQRKVHCFENVEALMQVKGIGEKFIEQHKAELIAKGCEKK